MFNRLTRFVRNAMTLGKLLKEQNSNSVSDTVSNVNCTPKPDASNQTLFGRGKWLFSTLLVVSLYFMQMKTSLLKISFKYVH